MSNPLVQTTGRRKRAVARVRVKNGSGTITVNGRTLEDFFPSDTHRMIITEPLRITSTTDPLIWRNHWWWRVDRTSRCFTFRHFKGFNRYWRRSSRVT